MNTTENKKVYVVTWVWNDCGDSGSLVEKAFSSQEAAKEYATRRFWEERNMGKYKKEKEDWLNIKEASRSMSMLYDDYWYRFDITERPVE